MMNGEKRSNEGGDYYRHKKHRKVLENPDRDYMRQDHEPQAGFYGITEPVAATNDLSGGSTMYGQFSSSSMFKDHDDAEHSSSRNLSIDSESSFESPSAMSMFNTRSHSFTMEDRYSDDSQTTPTAKPVVNISSKAQKMMVSTLSGCYISI